MKNFNKIFIAITIASLIFACKKEKEEEPQVGNRAPGNFSVYVSPAENAVLISWTAATDPDGDVVSYAVILEGDTLITETNQLLFNVDSLNFETIYMGSVVASDNKGLKNEVEFEFTTGVFPNDPPGEFTLTFPDNNGTNISLLPNLIWNDALDPEGGAVTYMVLLDTSNPPVNVVDSGQVNPNFTINIELIPETIYYWTVIAQDEFGAETMSEIFSFTTQGTLTAVLLTEDPGFDDRAVHSSFVFDNKIWVIGGNNCCGGRFDDVWYSEDGSNWILATDEPGWPARTDFTSMLYDNKMWVMGGNSQYISGFEFNDVWYSENGVDWTMATGSAEWSPRYGLESGVIDGKMWVFGGGDAIGSTPAQQAWSSMNGVNWTLESEDIGISVNQSDLVTFQNKIWKIDGGFNDKVYSTANGVDWDLVLEGAPYGARVQSATAVYDDKLWLISGRDTQLTSQYEIPDMWYSEDGITWIQATSDAGFAAVESARAVSFNDNLYLIGGASGTGNNEVTNDVYLFE